MAVICLYSNGAKIKTALTARNFIDHLYRFLTKRYVYHGLFWLVLYASLVFVAYDPQRGGIGYTLFNETIDLCFYAILVYFNLLYLIPQYLARRVFVYVGLVLAACAIVAPIKVLVFYLKFSGQPTDRLNLVANQSSAFGVAFLVVALSTVLNIITGWWRYQQEKQLLLTKTMQSELRFLKSQINPHFLFNTLNNLYSLTHQKSDRAPDIVLKLSEIMRYMLYECNEKRVLLSREVQYMQNYLDLERLRQLPSTEIRLTTEGFISDQEIAPLLFIPFLENSFKHGMNNSIGDAIYVRARLRVQDEDLEFFIENSKSEHVPQTDHRRSGGIGLNNVRHRLELLYPGNYDLHIENEPRRYAVTLLLKMIKE